MKRALAGVFLTVLVVMGLPATATSAGLVISGSVSTSYSGQGGYSVSVFNPVEGTVRATVTNAGVGSKSMSCQRLSADGLGAWRCSLGGGRLAPGSITVSATATPKGGGSTLRTSKSGSVSVRALSISGPGTVNQGQTFSVSGSTDLVVSATVSGGGTLLGCSESGSRYTCSVRASSTVTGPSTTHTVTVTEIGPGGYTKSRSTNVTVLGSATPTPTPNTPPSEPSISIPGSVDEDKQPLTVKGSTSTSGVTVQVLVDPPAARDWGSAVSCASSGAWSCALRDPLPVGKHTIVARSVDPTNPNLASGETVFQLTVNSIAPAKPQPTIKPSPVPLNPTEEPPAVIDEEQEPADEVAPGVVRGGLGNVLELLILGLAIITLARPGALTRLRPSSSASFTGRNPGEATEVEPVGWGDQSPTWAAFGTDATDYWSREAPPKIAAHSPFLARLLLDGVGFRAMFGSLWWLLQIGGVALGVLAANDTGFDAVPPSLALLAGILVLSCFDAMAGFLATLTFTVLVLGDLDGDGLAVVVALGVLWTALPLIADLLRPMRRVGRGWTYRWDRLADAAIGALVVGWLVQRLAGGMDAIADASTGLPADADTLGLVAGAAILGRVLLGSLVQLGYPERLRATEIFEDLPEPRTYAAVVGFVVRMGLFLVLGAALIGSCWQLWAGLLLFAVPDLIAGLRSRSSLAPTLRTGLPAGLTEILVLVVWCSLLVAFAITRGDSDMEQLQYAFVAAGLLPSVFALAQVLADPEAARPQTSWKLQLVGVAVLAATAALAIHGWQF